MFRPIIPHLKIQPLKQIILVTHVPPFEPIIPHLKIQPLKLGIDWGNAIAIEANNPSSKNPTTETYFMTRTFY